MKRRIPLLFVILSVVALAFATGCGDDEKKETEKAAKKQTDVVATESKKPVAEHSLQIDEIEDEIDKAIGEDPTTTEIPMTTTEEESDISDVAEPMEPTMDHSWPTINEDIDDCEPDQLPEDTTKSTIGHDKTIDEVEDALEKALGL